MLVARLEDDLGTDPFTIAETEKIPIFVKELRGAFGVTYGLVNNAGTANEGLLATMRNVENRGIDPSQRAIAHRPDEIRGAPYDGRGRPAHRQHLVHHR